MDVNVLCMNDTRFDLFACNHSAQRMDKNEMLIITLLTNIFYKFAIKASDILFNEEVLVFLVEYFCGFREKCLVLNHTEM